MPFMPKGWELVIIVIVVVLLIFGPKNLPKLGTAIGGFTKNLRSGLKKDDEGGEEVEAEVEEEKKDE